ncbi:MAG: cytochrome C [Acidobacteriota bacterium]
MSAAAYKGIEVMDSVSFCGTTCHTVMEPEHTVYLRSPHARVKCVECHIGPGAGWFVKSKLSGAWQLASVAFNLYDRPIPVPIHHLRPARETCEQCHWPAKFVGDRLSVRTHYEQDEENTELKTVLVLRVGGIEGRKASGIHWHVDLDIRIRYRSDRTRETIYEVEYTGKDGKTRLFQAPAPPSPGGGETGIRPGPWRVMDCIDCHNRPTHIYHLPGFEIDKALQEGRIDRTLPYIRREGLRLLRENHPTTEAALAAIHKELVAFYAENYLELSAARHAGIAEAARVLGEIRQRNVFPEMKVTWGTYPNHLGHTDSPGCFRCHDDAHVDQDGETISQDCSPCHTLLAIEEEDPEILKMLQP